MCASRTDADRHFPLRRSPRNMDRWLREDTPVACAAVLQVKSAESRYNDITGAQKSVVFGDAYKAELDEIDDQGFLPSGCACYSGFAAIMTRFRATGHAERGQDEDLVTHSFGAGSIRRGENLGHWRQQYERVESSHASAGFVLDGADGRMMGFPAYRGGVGWAWAATRVSHGTGFHTGADGSSRVRGGADEDEVGGCNARKARAAQFGRVQRVGLGANLEQAANQAGDLQEGGNGGVQFQPAGVVGWVAGQLMV